MSRCFRFLQAAQSGGWRWWCWLAVAGVAMLSLGVSAPQASGQGASSSGSSDRQIVDYINELIRKGWNEAGLSPSPPASDGEWVRRVYLDLLGRIPTAEETEAYLRDRSSNKREALVNRLLYSDEYLEQFAANWTTLWTNILIGRTGGTDRRSMVSRDGMQQYLRQSFLRNKPYDQMVYELISADGVNKPGEPDYNGAVNFILDNLDENAVPATAKTARIFLGMQVQCTQCHNHPFNDMKQDAFWGMNAYFRQVRALRTTQGRDVISVRLTDQDFPGEDNRPQEAAIFYELRNGLLRVAFPTFIDGTKTNPSGYVREVNRRDELASLVRSSPLLSRAIVNRMWAHFFGYGFTRPIDDMGPHNRPTHPELLDRLSQDFATYGYDLKQLIKWITLSEAYSLSSRMTERNKADDPSLGVKPMFSHFYLRQMTAEQLYDSLLVATDAHKTRGSYEDQERQKSQWLQQFAIAFGTDENDETTTFNGTIPQTLMMWNGELMQRATSGEPGSLLHRVANDPKLKDTDKIRYLYMAALSRPPSSSETKIAQQAWVAHKGNTTEALKDVFWTILNSNEFILQH
jgi:hypothetical protein